jgi:hypothetical protein
MKSSDVLHLSAPEVKPRKRVEPKAEPKPEAPKVKFTPAGESSDPAVHSLLARRFSAERNGDTAALEAIAKRLAELGYK